LTDEQKEKRAAKQAQVDLRALKEQALREPPAKGETAWIAFAAEHINKGSSGATQMKEIGARFKSLSPAELEVSGLS